MGKYTEYNGLDFDYSWMTDDDFVFISVDVDVDKIFKKVIETSKAHPLVCAPYKNTWIKNLLTVSFSS